MTSSLPDDAPAAPRSARFRVVLLAVLVVLLLGSAGALVWLLAGRTGEADDLQRERDAVMAQGRQFVLRSQTYGPDDLDDAGKLTDHLAAVREVTSDKFQAAYEESLPYVEQIVAERGAGQSATVLGVGVQYLDTDSARVLIAGESTFTATGADGQTQDPLTQTFRQVLDLVKVDGTWLVDTAEIAEDPAAAQGEAPTPDATTDPSADPSTGSTPPTPAAPTPTGGATP